MMQAKPLTMNGVPQIHGFHFAGDKDYYVVNGLTVGQWYDATTSHLVNEADTYMVLRDENLHDFSRKSDDVGPACHAQPGAPQDCASSIQLARHVPRTLLHFGADAGVPSRRLTESLSRL